MKEKFVRILPELVLLAAAFYLLPLLVRDTGGAMLLMLCVIPLTALSAGVISGVRLGFGLTLSLAALVLFAPSIPIFYNGSAWVYAPFYALLVLAGSALGGTLHGRR